MSTLYLITGPAAVGKSTVSKLLAKQLKKSALIEGDEIYHQVIGGYVPAWKEGNHSEIFKKICIQNIKLYLEQEYDVVFNYIITPLFLDELKSEFKEYNINFVVLMADEQELLLRDSYRPENFQMKDRCKVLLNNFKSYNYNEKNILNTTDLSVKETIDLILNSRNVRNEL